MKRILALLVFGLMSTGCDACGNVSTNNELVGQPKRLHNQTPIFCDNRVDLDVSMGYMKDGVGSVSTHDATMTVPNQRDVDTLNRAINENKLVRLHYNTARFTWCWQIDIVTNAEIFDNP